MARDESAAWLLLIVAVIAVVGLGLAASAFVTHNTLGGMMGSGGMMNGGQTSTQDTGPGAFEWTILLVSAALFVASLFLWSRGRPSRDGQPAAEPAPAAVAPIPAPPAMAAMPAPSTAQDPGADMALLKLLGGDEKRMYLELREHGGSMLQKDIVGLGIFSKAKVTRVLDKLEAKGLVLREAHGMTNRVRLVNRTAR